MTFKDPNLLIEDDEIIEEPGNDAEPEDRPKAPDNHRIPAEGDELPSADKVEDDDGEV